MRLLHFIVLIFGAASSSSEAAKQLDAKAILTKMIDEKMPDLKHLVMGLLYEPEKKMTTDKEVILTQRKGDMLQDITRSLINRYGAKKLPLFQQIDIGHLLDERIKEKINATIQIGPTCIDRPSKCDKKYPYRSMSGWCNHFDNRMVGSAMYPMRRIMGSAKYDDGFNTVRTRSVAGGKLPSTRVVSNKIFAEASIPAYDPKYNHLLMQFGQFLAHDILSTAKAVGPNDVPPDCSICESANLTYVCAPVEIPEDDPYFASPKGKRRCMKTVRASNAQTTLGPRVPINQNSHYVDLSMMYGSDECTAKNLRTLKHGQMKMYTKDGYTLPPQTMNDSNCESEKPFLCFIAGDSRCTLQAGLIPFHVIFLKHHNKMAGEISKLRRNWNDEKVYQETRRLTTAIWQYQAYAEYLPKIIGKRLMDEFDLNPSGLKKTFNASVDPSLSVEFAAAAFRFGHSQARKDLPRVDDYNRTVGAYADLGDNCFRAELHYDRTSTIFNMAQGMASMPAMAVNRQFSFPMRNRLFEKRGFKGTGIDLAAMNINRGREMGVQGYNEVRAKIPGLKSVKSFDDLKKDLDDANIELLKQTYAVVDDIDLFVGILLEKVVDPTAIIGPTGGYLIAEQFSSFKKGDRFFYQNTDNLRRLTKAEYNAIRNYSFAQIMCENTDGMGRIQRDAFKLKDRQVKCNSFKPFPLASVLHK